MLSGIAARKASKSLVAHQENGLPEKETSFHLHQKQPHPHLEDFFPDPPTPNMLFEALAWHGGRLSQKGTEPSRGDKKEGAALFAAGLCAPPTTQHPL